MVFVLIAFPVVLYVVYMLVMNRLEAVRELGDLRRTSTDRRSARTRERSHPASPRTGGSTIGPRGDIAGIVRPNPAPAGFPSDRPSADRSRSAPLPRTSRQAPSLERRVVVPHSWFERHKLKRAQLKREGLRRKEARRQAAAAKLLRPRGPGSRKARSEARAQGLNQPAPPGRRPSASGRPASSGRSGSSGRPASAGRSASSGRSAASDRPARPERSDPPDSHERLKPQHIDMDFEDTAWSTVFARTPRNQMTPPAMDGPKPDLDPRTSRRPHDDRPHGIPGPPGSSGRRRRRSG